MKNKNDLSRMVRILPLYESKRENYCKENVDEILLSSCDQKLNNLKNSGKGKYTYSWLQEFAFNILPSNIQLWIIIVYTFFYLGRVSYCEDTNCKSAYQFGNTVGKRIADCTYVCEDVNVDAHLEERKTQISYLIMSCPMYKDYSAIKRIK